MLMITPKLWKGTEVDPADRVLADDREDSGKRGYSNTAEPWFNDRYHAWNLNRLRRKQSVHSDNYNFVLTGPSAGRDFRVVSGLRRWRTFAT